MLIKLGVFFIVLVTVVSGFSVTEKADPLRLIEYNETTRVWMPLSKVENLKAECGAGKGFMDVTDFQERVVYKKPQQHVSFPDGPTHQTTVNNLIAEIKMANMQATITDLSAYSTRYYTSVTGEESAQYLLKRYKDYGERHDAESDFFTHSWRQPSIITRIEGSTYPDEVIILGGHIDSIAPFSFTSPGADDDASGSSCVLEAFRVLVESGFKPERTIEFHGYSAEEVGLRGSQAIAQFYASKNINVVAMMQLDMTGYVLRSPEPQIGLITDYTDADLNEFIRKLIDEYCTIKYVNSVCGYGCSDHASWTSSGYPSAFPFEAKFDDSNPNIHTSSDTTAYISPEHLVQFVRLGLGFLVELSFGPTE